MLLWSIEIRRPTNCARWIISGLITLFTLVVFAVLPVFFAAVTSAELEFCCLTSVLFASLLAPRPFDVGGMGGVAQGSWLPDSERLSLDEFRSFSALCCDELFPINWRFPEIIKFYFGWID